MISKIIAQRSNHMKHWTKAQYYTLNWMLGFPLTVYPSNQHVKLFITLQLGQGCFSQLGMMSLSDKRPQNIEWDAPGSLAEWELYPGALKVWSPCNWLAIGEIKNFGHVWLYFVNNSHLSIYSSSGRLWQERVYEVLLRSLRGASVISLGYTIYKTS